MGAAHTVGRSVPVSMEDVANGSHEETGNMVQEEGYCAVESRTDLLDTGGIAVADQIVDVRRGMSVDNLPLS